MYWIQLRSTADPEFVLLTTLSIAFHVSSLTSSGAASSPTGPILYHSPIANPLYASLCTSVVQPHVRYPWTCIICHLLQIFGELVMVTKNWFLLSDSSFFAFYIHVLWVVHIISWHFIPVCPDAPWFHPSLLRVLIFTFSGFTYLSYQPSISLFPFPAYLQLLVLISSTSALLWQTSRSLFILLMIWWLLRKRIHVLLSPILNSCLYLSMISPVESLAFGFVWFLSASNHPGSTCYHSLMCVFCG